MLRQDCNWVLSLDNPNKKSPLIFFFWLGPFGSLGPFIHKVGEGRFRTWIKSQLKSHPLLGRGTWGRGPDLFIYHPSRVTDGRTDPEARKKASNAGDDCAPSILSASGGGSVRPWVHLARQGTSNNQCNLSYTICSFPFPSMWTPVTSCLP